MGLGSSVGGCSISSLIPSTDGGPAGEMILLFRSGERPSIDDVRSAVGRAGRLSIIHDLSGEQGRQTSAVELLRDGMTFDLDCLAPGDGCSIPAINHAYGMGDSRDAETDEAISLKPGPHLVAGSHSIPIVRAMAGIASDLANELEGCVAVIWPPARAIVGRAFFGTAISTWLDGGAFPALGLTSIDDDPEGGMRTNGLAWFTGQEVRLAAELTRDRAAAARLAIRLVNQLVSQGRLTQSEVIIGPDGGRLALEPTKDGCLVRVRAS